MVIGLLLGWILSLFGFFNVVQTGMNELFGIVISMPTYYFIFAIIGILTPKSKVKTSKSDNND